MMDSAEFKKSMKYMYQRRVSDLLPARASQTVKNSVPCLFSNQELERVKAPRDSRAGTSGDQP